MKNFLAIATTLITLLVGSSLEAQGQPIPKKDNTISPQIFAYIQDSIKNIEGIEIYDEYIAHKAYYDNIQYWPCDLNEGGLLEYYWEANLDTYIPTFETFALLVLIYPEWEDCDIIREYVDNKTYFNNLTALVAFR